MEPGVDPVAEADRRGTILIVFRMGNMDLEAPKAAAAANNGNDGIDQASYRLLDGDKKEFAEPLPIAPASVGVSAVPAPMVAAGYGMPGMPGGSPISGVGGVPVWGYPITGTPIGLAGPPHIPFGAPAGLKSYTMRNLSPDHLPGPVDHMLVDVKHTPGYSLPAPVKHIEYTEEHPVIGEGQLAYPKWALPDGNGGGANCPPQGAPGPAMGPGTTSDAGGTAALKHRIVEPAALGRAAGSAVGLSITDNADVHTHSCPSACHSRDRPVRFRPLRSCRGGPCVGEHSSRHLTWRTTGVAIRGTGVASCLAGSVL